MSLYELKFLDIFNIEIVIKNKGRDLKYQRIKKNFYKKKRKNVCSTEVKILLVKKNFVLDI